MPEFIRPEFFDIFGLGVFGFLAWVSLIGFRTKQPLPKWILWVILTIAILGLIVDGTIVVRTYFL